MTTRKKTTPASTPGSFAPHMRSEAEANLSTSLQDHGPVTATTDSGWELEYDWEGEGFAGEFDPDDEFDRPLARFRIRRGDEEASWCTSIPADTTTSRQLSELLAAQVELLDSHPAAVSSLVKNMEGASFADAFEYARTVPRTS